MRSALMNAARLARWRLRRARRKSGGPEVPALFANSFPKSGTHLLTQVLAGFDQLGPFVETGLSAVTMYDGLTGEARPAHAIKKELSRLLPGDIRYGHLHATEMAVSGLCRAGVAPYFILRDPRDVVVSHVFYVTEIAPNHVLHPYYQTMESFDQRLNTSILGVPEIGFDFPDVRARFAPYIGWLDRPEVLTLHFEDFLADQESALQQILVHAQTRGFAYTGDHEEAVRILAGVIDPKRSPTFRSGKSGGWREHFTPAHKELFKEVTGDLLVRLGYEEDASW